MKLLCAVVGGNSCGGDDAKRLGSWNGSEAQQQCVDNAEDPRVCANANGERGNGESRVPRADGPKPKRVPDILRYFARNL